MRMSRLCRAERLEERPTEEEDLLHTDEVHTALANRRSPWRRRGWGLLLLLLVLAFLAVLNHSRGGVPWREQNVRQGLSLQAQTFCGDVEVGIEYHTRTSLSSIGAVDGSAYSAEQCCAVCYGHPDCRAWTWANSSVANGLACQLKTLAPGEQVRRKPRAGVVSGLVVHRTFRKHGFIASMLSKTKPVGASGPGAALQPIEANETCRGLLDVEGHGNFSVINARMGTPSTPATAADVAPGRWAVIPHMGSRAYLAERCTPGKYKQADYAALKLLGRTFRYKVDLSGLGCGCNALLQLLPMRQNSWRSTCHDYFCSPSRVCGVPCTEIEVMSSNQYSWTTSLHAHDDQAGVAMGYSGGTSWVGSRDWNSSQYSPGGKCIDTSWPFEVAISFPTNKDGRLEAVEVKLSQSHIPCSVGSRIDKYSFRGRDGIAEISAVLKAGVTPVMSYWSSPDMLWLDGPGMDGEGPCIQDAPEACPSSFRFFDFAVEDIGHREPERLSIFDEAMRTVHGKLMREKEMHQREQLEALDDMKELKKDCGTDCSTFGGMNVNRTYGKEVKPTVPEFNSHDETREDNTEWEVVVDKAVVQTWSGEHLAKPKLKGEIITGQRIENFVKLAFEDGYVPITEGLKEILRKRTVSYVLIATGTCADRNLQPISDVRTCQAAGYSLGYFDTHVEVFTDGGARPDGCHLAEGELALTEGASGQKYGATGRQRPICSSMKYPTTTTTTTTTTTITMTTQTTTTRAWGYPSLFCFLAMRATGDSGEVDLVKAQVKRGVGIFTCDEHAVFTENRTVVLGRTPNGESIESIPFEDAQVWVNQRGVAANVLVFLHVWEALKRDGRYSRLQWTIKVDPDTVVIPRLVRRHLEPHTGTIQFLVNCMSKQKKAAADALDRAAAPALDGALEAYSSEALEVYFQRGYQCMSALKWSQWTEGHYMGKCLNHLGVGYFLDESILLDKQLKGSVSCSNVGSAAFHDFKDADSWLSCWNQAVR